MSEQWRSSAEEPTAEAIECFVEAAQGFTVAYRTLGNSIDAYGASNRQCYSYYGRRHQEQDFQQLRIADRRSSSAVRYTPEGILLDNVMGCASEGLCVYSLQNGSDAIGEFGHDGEHAPVLYRKFFDIDIYHAKVRPLARSYRPSTERQDHFSASVETSPGQAFLTLKLNERIVPWDKVGTGRMFLIEISHRINEIAASMRKKSEAIIQAAAEHQHRFDMTCIEEAREKIRKLGIAQS